MGRPLIDLTSRRAGFLVVLGRVGDAVPVLWRKASAIGRGHRRSNQRITFAGRAATVAEWAELTGIRAATIATRLGRLRWPSEVALTQPTAPRRRYRRPHGPAAHGGYACDETEAA